MKVSVPVGMSDRMARVTAVKQQRPAPDYATGPVTRGLRLASLLGVVALTVYVLVRYPSLPEVVPVHFNFSGAADGFGSRSSMLWLAGVMLAISVLMAWLSTKPNALNYPGDITEANAQRIYREGERMMVWVLVSVAVLYLGIVLQTFAGVGADAGADPGAGAGERAGSGAGQTLLVVGLVGMLASTLVGIARLVIADTPPKQPGT